MNRLQKQGFLRYSRKSLEVFPLASTEYFDPAGALTAGEYMSDRYMQPESETFQRNEQNSAVPFAHAWPRKAIRTATARWIDHRIFLNRSRTRHTPESSLKRIADLRIEWLMT